MSVVSDLTCSICDILTRIELTVGWDYMTKIIKVLGFNPITARFGIYSLLNQSILHSLLVRASASHDKW